MMTNDKYTRLVKLQKAFFNEHITREIPFRLCALDRLAEALVSREKQLGEALHADLGKSAFESYATEIGFLLHEIRTTKNHLQSWARDRHRPTPLFLFGSKSRIHYEPYGCTLIIAPWNYPLQLALSPLIGAIAAGNCAIVKPSGEAPRTAAALQELIDECFEEEYIAVTDADRETTELLLQERFDYIFYTGSVEYGRHVMQAASRHLTPVTLELGGKSPCIVDDDADLKAAARRIVWGKFLNCGQTCVAPDYLMVHRKVQDKLTEHIRDEITRQYGENPQQSPDYPRIVNARHFDRLSALLSHGTMLCGGTNDPSDRYMAPTLLTDIPPQSPPAHRRNLRPHTPRTPVRRHRRLCRIRQRQGKTPRPLLLYPQQKTGTLHDTTHHIGRSLYQRHHRTNRQRKPPLRRNREQRNGSLPRPRKFRDIQSLPQHRQLLSAPLSQFQIPAICRQTQMA